MAPRSKKTTRELACIILAAGQGTRMKSSMPKVMHPIASRPMIGHVIATAAALNPKIIVPVIAPGFDTVAEYAAPHKCAIQKIARGTGDAVKSAVPLLKKFTGDVLVLYGDVPLLDVETLRQFIAYHRRGGFGITVLGMEPDDPTGYGRLFLNEDGTLERIIEHKDATENERHITLCNSGVMVIDGARLEKWIGKIKPNNIQKEYYLVDLPAIAARDGAATGVFIGPAEDLMGVNDRIQLAIAEAGFQDRARHHHMRAGVTLTDPGTIYFSADTQIAPDVTVGPGVVFGPGVKIDRDVEIKAYSCLEGVQVKSGASVGPFARIRPGTVIGEGARIGNFVEIKNTKIGRGAKANHLAYLGDATLGDRANFGCGAITVNYDGKNKHKTIIGDDVMVGCNVNLVAPVSVGDDAYIAAGSTVTKNVQGRALAIARTDLTVKKNWVTPGKKPKGKK